MRESSIFKYSSIILVLTCSVEIGLYIISNINIKCPNESDALKIMSYNLLFNNKAPKNSLSVIKNVDPDILFIQELTPDWEKLILQEIKDKYPFKITFPLKGTHGIGIFSKYRITHQSVLNNNNNKPFAQIAELCFKNKKVQIINTHLASPAAAVENPHDFINLYTINYKERKKEISSLLEETLPLSNKYDCQILVGDLNTLKFEPIYKKIQLNWVNTNNRKYNISDCNFPNTNKSRPFITLDYIMVRGKVAILDYKTIKGGSSDHLSIVSSINI